MKNKLLDGFKARFNLDDEFMEIVASLFEKLLSFGYISKSMEKTLIQKLNENVVYLFFGSDGEHDYKSGFYDADKKTMYIQNKKAISAIYLRLLYAMTSKEIDMNTHNMGFSTTYMSGKSYKLLYRNFAINRAVIANLVCRLTGTPQINMKLIPGRKAYNHNFLGYEISADNDIYAFEGRIFSQMCFSTGIHEENFYYYLFSKSPVDSMNKMFNKTKFIDKIEFLTLFDNTSRSYSTYCKLMYFSNLLNKNYKERRKGILAPEAEIALEVEESKVQKKIKDFIYSINKSKKHENENDVNFELEASLSYTIESLEKIILENTVKMQDILASNIITGVSYLTPYLYANKLKEFSSLVIMPNKKLEDAIYHTIMFKLVPEHEAETTNIIQKIRYCIISKVLESDKYTKSSSKIAFYRVEKEITEENCELAILTINNTFSSIANIEDINTELSSLNKSATYVPFNDLKVMSNKDKSHQIILALKSYFANLRKVSLDSVFLFNMLCKEYVIVNTNNTVFMFELLTPKGSKNTYSVDSIPLSSGFSLFDLKKKKKIVSTLPTLYKEKRRIFGFLGI